MSANPASSLTPSSSSLATPSSTSLASASILTPSSSSSTFTYPPLHSFPPFYTLQPNLITRASQLASWSSFILTYCAHYRLFRLSSSHTVFHNQSLNRRFAPEDVKVLFSFMREKGRAEYVDTSAATSRSRASGWIPGRSGTEETGSKDEVFVYWRTLEEWASELVDWVEETGQKNSVLTVHELTEGDQIKGKSWEAMPLEVIKKVLAVVAKRGRGVVFGEEEGLGVKFY